MIIEIELKLTIPVALAQEFIDYMHAQYGKHTYDRHRLLTFYYDSDDFYLLKHEAVLRIRERDGQWIQVLKSANAAEGGLHKRCEWSQVLKNCEPDLRVVELPGTKNPEWYVQHPVQKIFETDMQRHRWFIEYDVTDIELSLDQGEVRANGLSAPISEIELELVAGDEADLFKLADELKQVFPALKEESVSKAERGYGLL